MYRTLSDFYRSKEWVLFRLSVIHDRRREGLTICEYCGRPIVKEYDCIAHHTEYLTERNVNDSMVALNPQKIMLVHHACHNRIHNKLGNIHKEIYLVYGSPLSGKSTYVDSVRDAGDLIVDMDSIWEMISGCDRYIKPGRLKDNVFAVRDCLLDQVRTRRGGWHNAYVIGGYPLSSERERLCKSLGAKEIYVESTQEECMLRLENLSDTDVRKRSEWKSYINEWWSKYSPPPLTIKGSDGDC